MSVPQMSADELDELHWDVIEILREGRATPNYLSERTGESRALVSQRLRDLQIRGSVNKVSRGLYELVPEELPDEDE